MIYGALIGIFKRCAVAVERIRKLCFTTLAYMTKIVKDWQNAGIKNIDDAKKYFEGNAAGKPNKKAPNKFAQRKYSQEELSKFGHRIGVIDDGENT